jgi:hypothetical protein
MPAKKTQLPESERAKRLREAARDLGTDESKESFERAFKKVLSSSSRGQRRSAPEKP